MIHSNSIQFTFICIVLFSQRTSFQSSFTENARVHIGILSELLGNSLSYVIQK